MTTQPDTIRQGELLNQLVIDRTTMEEIGRVEVLWTYPPAHKVLGFVCKSGLLGAKKYAFNLGQIHSLGASILVNSGAQETDGDKVSQLESLIGCEVWSEAGERIGRVNDCVFNLKTGLISDYLVSPGGLAIVTDGVFRLPPSKILSSGRRRILITEASARSLEPYRTGIKGRLTKVTDSLAQRAQSATEQVKDRARRLADQTKDRAEFLREESQFLVQQARDRSQDFVEQVKERGQTIGEQVKENTQSWTERVQEQLETVVEELGVPESGDRSPQAWDDSDAAEIPPLDEEDLLSGDWGLPVPPVQPQAAKEPAAEEAGQADQPPIESPAEPDSWLETTPAYALDPLPEANLDDDFWDQPSPAPQISDAAIDVAAAQVAEAPIESPTEDRSVQSESTEDKAIESESGEDKSAQDKAIVPPEKDDDEPWI